MKIALLTTQTPHHAYFASQIMSWGHELVIISETGSISFPYLTAHKYETGRDNFERKHWFCGADAQLEEFGTALSVENINCIAAKDFLVNFNAEITFVFGTRMIKPSILKCLRNNAYNFHGGNPEVYRGLDSHLWALWHREFSELKTCMHCLTSALDGGDIISLRSLDLNKLNSLEMLRILNTENCVQMAHELLEKLNNGVVVAKRQQTNIGRNYSAMPTILKDIVVKSLPFEG